VRWELKKGFRGKKRSEPHKTALGDTTKDDSVQAAIEVAEVISEQKGVRGR
jgi:hypothetical protein